MLFSMRPSIPASKDATERLQLLQEVHALVRSMLQLHKDEMHVRTEPSTTPHFAKGDKVPVVTANRFLRGQPNMKLRDRQLGPLCGGANWETQLQIETSGDNTLTSCVPCEQFTTVLYRSTTTSCPGICS
jgi:hypothetical protein